MNRSLGDADERPLEALVESSLAGSAQPGDAGRLSEILRSDAAVNAYLQQVRLHALLEWRHGKVQQATESGVGVPAANARIRRHEFFTAERKWPLRKLAIAATVLLCVGITILIALRSPFTEVAPLVATGEPVGTVRAMNGVARAAGDRPLTANEAIHPGLLAIDAGTLHFDTTAGATIVLIGPARVEVVSPMKLRTIAGRVTVRIDDRRATGFAVETPNADVIDLGTEFGVHVDNAGQTDVVVFDGKVDLSPKGDVATGWARDTLAPVRLTKGQGMTVDAAGLLQPIIAIARKVGSPEWRVGVETLDDSDPDAVITAVRDNRRDPGDTKYYQVVRNGLREDAPAYVDRAYQWNSIAGQPLPSELLGAELIETFNSDKREPDLELTIELARPAALYVFHEPRLGEVPEWLRRDFVDTGLKIGLDEGPPEMPKLALEKGPGQSIDRVFTVWRRDVREPGAVSLGRNSANSKSMYGVAAKALP